jgi:8-oxo-dGTP diphosphatase
MSYTRLLTLFLMNFYILLAMFHAGGMIMDRDPIIRVVGALIESNGKVLIARRKKGMAMEYLWEFPGGKIEPGETPQESLRRELLEELNIVTEIGECVGTGSHPFKHGTTVELTVYRAFLISGEITLVDHDEIAWVSPGDLRRYRFPQADTPIIERIIALSESG